MNKKIIFISLFVILCSSIFAQGVTDEESEIYNNIFTNFSSIEENGVKLQYGTKNNIMKEIEKISNIYNLEFIDSEIKKNDESYYYNKSIEDKENTIIVSASNEGQDTHIEVEIIEKTKYVNTRELAKKLEKLVDDTSVKPQYFSYVKGKLNSEKEINKINDELKEKLINNGAQKVNSIPINSGITGVALNNTDLNLNYSISEYSGGKYLIVGTPTIFTTY